tara:strand:+ start:105 stop:638 length:534 start_codon:yes stop_codon:yes gene_type:complete
MTLLITDNFLEPNDFQNLQMLMLGEDLPWYYMDKIDYPDDDHDPDKFQFTHAFYGGDKGPYTDYRAIVYEQFHFIRDPYRIKANLIPKTSEIKIGRFHTDIPKKHLAESHTTSIFYVNTNNGYTEFEDGTIIESVANRFVTFPTVMRHRGTSCTDKKIRVVINFNYSKGDNGSTSRE